MYSRYGKRPRVRQLAALRLLVALFGISRRGSSWSTGSFNKFCDNCQFIVNSFSLVWVLNRCRLILIHSKRDISEGAIMVSKILFGMLLLMLILILFIQPLPHKHLQSCCKADKFECRHVRILTLVLGTSSSYRVIVSERLQKVTVRRLFSDK